MKKAQTAIVPMLSETPLSRRALEWTQVIKRRLRAHRRLICLGTRAGALVD